jgi:hypothetical protein
MSEFHSLSNLFLIENLVKIDEDIEGKRRSFLYMVYSKEKRYLAFGTYESKELQSKGYIVERIFSFDEQGKLIDSRGRHYEWDTSSGLQHTDSFDVRLGMLGRYLTRFKEHLESIVEFDLVMKQEKMIEFHSLSNLFLEDNLKKIDEVEKQGDDEDFTLTFSYIIHSKEKKYLAFGTYQSEEFYHHQSSGTINENIFSFDEEGKLTSSLGRDHRWNTKTKLEETGSFNISSLNLVMYLEQYKEELKDVVKVETRIIF